MLRGTVRTKNNVQGSKARFQKVGKGTASTKARHSLIPTMNVDHNFVEATLEDHYASDYSDMLDEIKHNIDERNLLARAGARALGRKTDEIILTQMYTATTTAPTTAGGLTVAKIDEAISALLGKDVEFDGQIFCPLSPTAWTQLFNIDTFVSADYVGDHPLTKFKQSAVHWKGVNWFPHTGLQHDGTNALCPMYHMSALGHAIGAEVATDITWQGERAAHFISNSMSQGATKIDDEGIVLISVVEPIVPTT